MNNALLHISVIIPVLNEAPRIAGVIEATRGLGDCEIIVVDGGSDDGTPAECGGADLCLCTEPGRAGQQNRGAAAARGDVLLFLHADCRLEPGAFEALRNALADPGCVGGCFRQVIDARGVRYRLLEWGNSLRVHACRWAYGDQGIFVRRSVFERVGGFPPLQFLEDLYLMKRLKREGRFVLAQAAIHTSARRWQARGVVRQTLRNWTLIALAHGGVSPNRLARFYTHVR